MSDKDKKRVSLDREKHEHADRLKKSLTRVKWSQALMQLFWTAGPVTTLGLIGGYYLGYGVMPPTQLLIYFVSFTIFSGVIGLIAKVVYDGTRGHLADQAERDLLSVTDKLGDLILIARDKVVQGHEGDARKREAALQLLRRVDLTPYGITIAFTDLTGNEEIGRVMGEIHAYRRIGLQTRVRELYAEHRDQITESIRNLGKESPQSAKELKRWFTGNTTGRLKYGVPREKFFLQRVMSAIENNNPYLMTSRDVEEMMILGFELICGREIPSLIFTYPGRWKYASALDELEKSRSRYRVTQARGGNRLRALAAYLVESGVEQSDQLPEGLPIDDLSRRVNGRMNRLAVRARAISRDPDVDDQERKKVANVLENCIELYEMAYKGYKVSARRHRELMQATDRWERVVKEAGGSPGSLKVGRGRRGIRIRESMISLSEEAKLEVCRDLVWYFQKVDLKRYSHSLFSSFDNRGAMAARQLAIEIALALEPHIGISKPEIQRNINATKAIYLGGLSPDLSALQKQELGIRMAREVDKGLGIAAIRLADTLVHQYRVELSPEAIRFLRTEFKAGRQSLERVVNRIREDQPVWPERQERPSTLGEPPSSWKKSLQELKKIIT